MMLCRFCEEEKKLIAAHVIPWCLYEPLRYPSPMVLVSTDSYPKFLPKGQYDREILCADCDNKFSPWEDYTAKLLMNADAYQKYRDAKPGDDFYMIPEYDYAKLKLCLLSILWRMSISKLPSFKRIALGPFESVIRKMLLDRNPGRTDQFPVLIFRLTDKIGSETLRGTERRKRHGVNVYDLGLPGYICIIKVDAQPTPLPLGPRVLAPKEPLVIGLKKSNYSLEKITSQFLDKPSRKT
jgi:hypothetical protein